MPTPDECICCKEIKKVNEKIGNEQQCLINHSGFKKVCLDLNILQTAYFGYKQEFGDDKNTDINVRYYNTSRRQLARWCYGHVDKEIKSPLPSCAVKRIKDEFPTKDRKEFNPKRVLPPLDKRPSSVTTTPS